MAHLTESVVKDATLGWLEDIQDVLLPRLIGDELRVGEV
jgi:hypothetical protein